MCNYKARGNDYVVFVFATSGCGGLRTARRPLPRVDRRKRETWVRVLGDVELFRVPKEAVWRTQKQAKRLLEKKWKKTEAVEEGEGDNDDKDANTTNGDGDVDGDRDGDGDGGGQGPKMGQGQVTVHWRLAGMRAWGWRSPRWRVKAWWVTSGRSTREKER